MYELTPQYDSRKSFYNKALVIVNPDTSEGQEHKSILRSYQTIVAAITADGHAKVFGTYSNTTLRHIKEYLKQGGFKADSKKQIIEDYS